ncbi:MAG: bifunctional phosphoribosyl-AMP cyclohydrolase/phosphoribosyl-ATP diphosphatase HisIE [Bacteroidetes bacterium]|nr:bifunctional phosphoribosyl-AMP cyclohydrolase/phosphoribosyl-ATP diphosphatase HisIE [Bacteroidota bacterium]
MKPDFNKSADGLIPAIIQDSSTNRVLMLGYMNKEAFEKTSEKKLVTFFSRSKNRLWTKGEESGHFLKVKEIKIDCDDDTLLIKADPLGPICHTGQDTCFNEINAGTDFLLKLEKIILDRKANPSDQSYTSSLFKKGINKIAQKVGEEAVELVIEAKDNNEELFKNEAADLLYHYLILLSAKDFSLSDIIKVLETRHSAK